MKTNQFIIQSHVFGWATLEGKRPKSSWSRGGGASFALLDGVSKKIKRIFKKINKCKFLNKKPHKGSACNSGLEHHNPIGSPLTRSRLEKTPVASSCDSCLPPPCMPYVTALIPWTFISLLYCAVWCLVVKHVCCPTMFFRMYIFLSLLSYFYEVSVTLTQSARFTAIGQHALCYFNHNPRYFDDVLC